MATEAMKNPVIFECSDFMIINKPSGISVYHGAGITEQLTLLDMFSSFIHPKGIVHRIDKATSGCMILAKTSDAVIRLKQMFHDREIRKYYLGVSVLGEQLSSKERLKFTNCPEIDYSIKQFSQSSIDFEALKGGYLLDGYITRYQRKKFRFTSNTTPHGKRALTEIYPMGYQKRAGVVLFAIRLHTGRTHQIRATFYHVGIPLLGDELYNTKLSRIVNKNLKVSRLMLHSKSLEFSWPGSSNGYWQNDYGWCKINNGRVHAEAAVPKL